MKVQLAGAGIALVAGLALGGLMQPHLYDGDRPSGPQMFAGWAGTRSTGPFDPGTTFASYSGPAPDYVIGTDWKKTMAWPSEPAAVSPPERQIARYDAPTADDPPPLTRAAYEEPPAPAHDYPSMVGAHPSVIEVPAAEAAVSADDAAAPAANS